MILHPIIQHPISWTVLWENQDRGERKKNIPNDERDPTRILFWEDWEDDENVFSFLYVISLSSLFHSSHCKMMTLEIAPSNHSSFSHPSFFPLRQMDHLEENNHDRNTTGLLFPAGGREKSIPSTRRGVEVLHKLIKRRCGKREKINENDHFVILGKNRLPNCPSVSQWLQSSRFISHRNSGHGPRSSSSSTASLDDHH